PPVKCTGIGGRQSAVFVKAHALRVAQCSGKQNQGAKNDQKRANHVCGKGGGKALQRNPAVKDLVCHYARVRDGNRKEKNSEEALRFAHESQSGRAVGMRREELQIEPTDAGQELEPEKQPPEPSIDKELEQRRTERAEPPSSPGDRTSAVAARCVPGIDIHGSRPEG